MLLDKVTCLIPISASPNFGSFCCEPAILGNNFTSGPIYFLLNLLQNGVTLYVNLFLYSINFIPVCKSDAHGPHKKNEMDIFKESCF